MSDFNVSNFDLNFGGLPPEPTLPKNWEYYHSLFKRIKPLEDNEYTRELQADLYIHTSDFFNNNQKAGVVDLESLPKEKIELFIEQMFETFKQFYFSKNSELDSNLTFLETIKDIDGDSIIDNFLAYKLGGLDKHHFFLEIESLKTLRLENIINLSSRLKEAHMDQQIKWILRQNLTTLRHLHEGTKYLHMVIDHNPERLESYSKVLYRGIDTLTGEFQRIFQRLHYNYDPRNPDTFI